MNAPIDGIMIVVGHGSSFEMHKWELKRINDNDVFGYLQQMAKNLDSRGAK
jgi:hypothetical protein